MSRRRRRIRPPIPASTILLIVGIVLIAVLSIVLIRVQRGFLGIVLGSLAAVLLVYWLREIRQTIKQEWSTGSSVRFTQAQEEGYDVVESGDFLTIVTRVPGPKEAIRVTSDAENLEIAGSLGFVRKVKLPKKAEILTMSYVNGVLNVKLQKINPGAHSLKASSQEYFPS